MVRFKNKSLLPTLDGALLITILMSGLVALLTLLDTVTSKSLTDLTIGLSGEQVANGLPGGVVIDEAQALVTARTGLGYRLAWWFVGPASSLLVLAGASILREIVETARSGDPFVVANVQRLRVLGALTVGYLVFTVARSFVALAIQGVLGVEEVTTAISFTPIGYSVAFFALAEIWRRGVDMRDDHQLTV